MNYVVRVSGWDYYFSFRVSDPMSSWDAGPYNQLTTVSFTGDVIRPEDSKYRRACVTFSARAGMMGESRTEGPRAIGSLSAHEDRLSAYVLVPLERMAELAIAALSGSVKIIDFGSTRLRYRSGKIHSVSLNTRIEDEEI